jgi:hypothetical protein
MTDPAPPPPTEPAAAAPAASDASFDNPVVRRMVRWLPFAAAGHLLVGLPALLISLVVAWGTFVQARATQRMQQAASWPFVGYETSNYSADGRHRINLTLVNNGVGPALLGPVEVRYRGRAMRTPEQLLASCCGFRRGQSFQLASEPATNVALRPGERIAFFELTDAPVNAGLIARLEGERWRLRVRSCYCSVFDDCWVIDGRQAKPQAVPQCPADWVPYHERGGDGPPS